MHCALIQQSHSTLCKDQHCVVGISPLQHNRKIWCCKQLTGLQMKEAAHAAAQLLCRRFAYSSRVHVKSLALQVPVLSPAAAAKHKHVQNWNALAWFNHLNRKDQNQNPTLNISSILFKIRYFFLSKTNSFFHLNFAFLFPQSFNIAGI